MSGNRLCLFLFSAMMSLLVLFSSVVLAREHGHKQTVKYGFSLQNRSAELKKDLEFRVFVPVKRSADSVVVGVSSNYSYRLLEDAFGNQEMVLEIDHIAPHGSRQVMVSVDMEVYSDALPVLAQDQERFLSDGPMLGLDRPEVSGAALQFVQSEDPGREVLRWVMGHVQYDGYVKDSLGAPYALNNARGDCTEYMYLYMAMMRLSGIPARGVSGFLTEGRSRLKAQDYHNWVEVYQGGAWRIVDPQRGVYQKHGTGYVATRILEPLSESPDLMRRHWISDDQVEVSML